MIRKLMLATLVIAALGIIFTGCELEADKESDELPSRGYGTFKMVTDDIGPGQEFDETGNLTGRLGYWFDIDHDGVIEDYFYQLRFPTAGIVALGFGPDGYASAALPVAMNRLIPGKTKYEISLDSLTDWIKSNVAVGYLPGQYMDDYNTLVYTDRVTGEEKQAYLTGDRTEQEFRFISLANLDVPVASRGPGNDDATKSAPDDTSNDDQYYTTGDDVEVQIGEVNARCSEWGAICKAEEDCGLFTDGWSRTDCQQRLYNYYDGNLGSQYIACMKNCASGGCSALSSCKQDCMNQKLKDANGCAINTGPDINDVFYVVQRDDMYLFEEEGVTVSADDRLAIFIDYSDAEANITGGYMTVTVDGESYKINFVDRMGESSIKDRTYVGFTFNNSLPEGEHTFSIVMTDGELNGRPCFDDGLRIYNGKFTVEDPSDTTDTDPIKFNQLIEFYQIYTPDINKYNLGKGFIEPNAMNSVYLYTLEGFELSIVQAYLWSMIGTYDLGEMDMTEVNRMIFTSTQDIHGTKYDPSDDTQASAFYIDQPLGPGLFTFYGDAGWNLYPIAPYGMDNDDQPFIRGDFETTEIHMPLTPSYTVDPRYTGCNPSCEYYIDMVYDFMHKTLDFPSKEDALDSCKSDFRDSYWSCRVDCWKRAFAGINGCISMDDCTDSCPGATTPEPESYCDAGYADNLNMKMRLVIPEAYMSNCLYTKIIYGPNSPETEMCTWTDDEIENYKPLQMGLYGITASNTIEPVPGGYVDINWPQTDYAVPMPYGPKMPLNFLPIATYDGSVQGQMYLAAFQGDTLLATGYYSPDNVNDDQWAWLVIYSYNWSGPELEGWSLSTVSGNSITSITNFDPVLTMTFGDLRALVDDVNSQFLDPNASTL